MNLIFKQVSEDSELEKCAEVIRNSFITVAKDFNLTIDNAPTNAAFIKLENLIKMREKGIAMFSVYNEKEQVGFVAIERANENVFYMEKLAVLPKHRHKGYGKAIMDFVFGYVKDKGGKTVEIGIINENTILKKWYENYGFSQIGIKKFNHLPFNVCFMKKDV